MRFTPGTVPTALPPTVRGWLAEELRKIANALATVDNLQLPALAEEPARYSDGMVVYADGANWNPGSGAGFYGREAGAWVKL